MTIERIMRTTDLSAALEDFAAEVDEGNYGRLSYNFWKSLKKITTESTTIFLELNYFQKVITITNANRGVTLSMTDNSFGEFIEQTYYAYSIEKLTLDYYNANPVGFVKSGSFTTDVPSDLAKTFKELINNTDTNRKDNNIMNTFNFDFGPCTNDNVKMSIYGLAVKNSDKTWVSYDKANKKIVDVDIFNFDGRKFLYKVPVAIKDIVVGDMVIHQHKPVFVESVTDGIHVIDVVEGEKKTILPTTNLFGFDFITKIVSFVDFGNAKATADNPFGNILPFLLLSENNGKSDIDPLMLMAFAGGSQFGDLAKNPMMLYAMFNGGKSNDMLLPLLMMNGGIQLPGVEAPKN